MNKKAYLRTIEVAIAVILTFIVAYLIFPRAATPPEEAKAQILTVLEQSPGFRECAVSLDYDCVEAYLRDYVPPNYAFAYDLTENPEQVHANLPEKTIYSESIYISGNTNLYKPVIIKLYYWRAE